MANKWSAPWNTAMPIKHHFIGLEEIFILATKYPPRIHNGADSLKGTDDNGKMWIVSIAHKQVEPMHTC